MLLSLLSYLMRIYVACLKVCLYKDGFLIQLKAWTAVGMFFFFSIRFPFPIIDYCLDIFVMASIS